MRVGVSPVFPVFCGVISVAGSLVVGIAGIQFAFVAVGEPRFRSPEQSRKGDPPQPRPGIGEVALSVTPA
ncbi:hypothetical protein NIIDMKKI_76070 [Mycobacterium kansasii]|uniref:Uncharacterized protein n=1 Tax=Mycobacterium kansasii TaxID=1768 RepID=A0A7G1IN39_MYCKA|nr:hypothetical protein NIIDMKKI_76070 [Mycobacterium kansasii]